MPEVYGILENLGKIKDKLGSKYNAKKLEEYLINNITPDISSIDSATYIGSYDQDRYFREHFGNGMLTNIEKEKAKREYIVDIIKRGIEDTFCDDDDDYNRDGGPPKHELNSFPNNYVIMKTTFKISKNDRYPSPLPIFDNEDEKMLEGFFLITQYDRNGTHFNTFLDNLNNDPLFTNAAGAANAGGSYRRTRIRRRKNRMSRRKRTARRKH